MVRQIDWPQEGAREASKVCQKVQDAKEDKVEV